MSADDPDGLDAQADALLTDKTISFEQRLKRAQALYDEAKTLHRLLAEVRDAVRRLERTQAEVLAGLSARKKEDEEQRETLRREDLAAVVTLLQRLDVGVDSLGRLMAAWVLPLLSALVLVALALLVLHAF